MKNKVWVILIFVIFCLAGAAVGYRFLVKSSPVENVLPAGAVAYFKITDLAKTLDEFTASSLGKNLEKIDLGKILVQNKVPEETVRQYKKWREETGKVPVEKLVKKFFGREMAVAIYPFPMSPLNPMVFKQIAPQLLIVTRLSLDAEFMEFLASLYGAKSKDLPVQSEEYLGKKITSVVLNPDWSLYYSKINDILVLAFDRKAVQMAIDTATDSQKTLPRDAIFQDMRGRLPAPTRFFTYLNLDWTVVSLKKAVGDWLPLPAKDVVHQKLDKFFNRFNGFQMLGYAASATSVTGVQETSRSKMVLTFDKAKMSDQSLLAAYSQTPEENKSIQFAGKNVLVYQWSNCLNLKVMWESFKEEMAQIQNQPDAGQKTLEMMVGSLKDNWGLDIEADILPAFGREIGGFLTDIDLSGLVPNPKLVLFVSVNDAEAAKRILASLSQRIPMTRQRETHKDVTLEYFQLPLGISLQPGYCFWGEYLLLSTSRELLKEAIDAAGDQNLSLVTDSDFKKVNLGLNEHNNSVLFIRMDRTMETIRRLCDWGVGLLALQSAHLTAYEGGERQRLADLNKEVETLTANLQLAKDDLQKLKSEMVALPSQQRDGSGQLKQQSLEQAIAQQEQELTLARERQQGLDEMLKKSKPRPTDASLIESNLKEILFPILEGLKANKALGTRSRIKEGVLEVESFWLK